MTGRQQDDGDDRLRAQQRERMMLQELKQFHRERPHLLAPVASLNTRKRIRVPRLPSDANPFCEDRQLADEYELLNLNKNPRFYAHTIKNPMRIVEENPHNHSSFINQTADLMASSGFSPRIRPEFTSITPAARYQPLHFPQPSVVSVDPGGMRQRSDRAMASVLSPPTGVTTVPTRGRDVASSPAFHQYGHKLTTQPVTFGHRPHSAARMYDPLTNTVMASSSGSMPGKPPHVRVNTMKAGMSIMQLQELLTPSKPKSQQHQASGPTSDESAFKSSSPKLRKKVLNPYNEPVDPKVQALEELERGYQNTVFNPPRERKPVQFQPPTDQTTGQLIDKYRKLAVGRLPYEDPASASSR